MIQRVHYALLIALFIVMGLSARGADFRFSRHYSDNMVLQHGKPVLIRGFADKGADVTVTFAGQTRKAKADKNGEWSVTLDPMPANAEGQKLTVSSSRVTGHASLDNVVVGDVIMFARQTTIDVSLGRDEGGRKAARDMSARVMTIKTIPALEPQPDLAPDATKGWTALDRDAALKMDAAAFYMVKDLAAKTDVPVGIININLGRHFPIGWMSKEALLETTEIFGEKETRVNTTIKTMEELASRGPDHPKEKRRGYPRPPVEQNARYPAAGYNAVLHPMRGLAVKALLLQLGNDYSYYPYANLERDGKHTSRAHAAQAFWDCYLVRKWCLYLAPSTTPRLPNEWRKVLGDAALPVGWITPPGSELDTLGRHHREMRELQRRAAEKEAGVDLILPGTESIVLSAQPADDALLGSRCLAWVRGAVYKQDELAPTGPVFDRAELNGSTAQIFFKPGTAEGLKAAPGALEMFEVAAVNDSDNPTAEENENLEYVVAKATIEGDTIRLSSDTVEDIAFVRYNWKEKPDQGLTNASGLPAVPFNTDDGHEFPKRIHTSGEEKLPPEFFMSIADWEQEGPVIYDGKLTTGWEKGEPLGPTGILATRAYRRNFFVNNTYVGSPADGKLLHGDFIYGVNGKPFGDNPTVEVAEAITVAETEEAKGILSFDLLRNGKKMTVEIQLPVLGTFSETSPYNCPKTDRMVAEAEAQVAKRGGARGGKGRMGHPVFSNAEALFLLAAGTPKYQGLVRRQVYSRLTSDLSKPIGPLGRSSQGGPWDLSADMLLLSEYYLATGDRNVLPYLKHKCDGLTSIQIRHPDEKGPWPKVQNIGQMGGWRHNFYGGAAYGTMPAVGVPAVLGYHLTKEAGVQYNFTGYERAVHWFYHNGAQIGQINYGYSKEPKTTPLKIDPDKLAAGKLGPGNGAVAGAAILYDLRGNEKIAKINSHIATHCYNNLEYAHGGHFWGNLYTPLGAKVDGRESYQLFMKGYRNYQTITRLPDFSRDRLAGYGCYLGDVAHRERLRITGAHESVFAANPPKALATALEAYYKRDYAACEKAVNAVLARGELKGLDLKKAEQLRDAAVSIQKSIDHDLAKMQKLIAEKKPYEAGLDLAQLKAVMPEGSPELQAIETALNEPDMKKLVRDDRKRLNAYHASLELKRNTPSKEDGGPEWREIVSQSPGRGFALKSKGSPPTTWRMKVVESLGQAPEGWTELAFDDSAWSELTLPINWRENHTILLRAPFTIEDPAAVTALRFNQHAKHLSHMQVFINGRTVAKISPVSGGRVVNIPLNDHALKLLKKGRNTLSATYKNHLRWGGRGRPDGGGLNISLEMQEKTK